MQLATVNTKRSSLKVYSKANSAQINFIGSLNTGSMVEIHDTKTVNNVIWAKISAPGINGWVIQQHPSVNYSFLKTPSLSRAIDPNMGRGMVSINDGSAATDDSSYTIASTIDKVRETTGIVRDQDNEFTTGEVVIDNVTISPSISGSKSGLGSWQPDSSMPPRIVQNNKGYPFVDKFNSITNRWEYDYATDYSDTKFIKDLNTVRESVNLNFDDNQTLFGRYANYYNRYKVPMVNDGLEKSFAHVFFTRPDCNIVKYTGNGKCALCDTVSGNPDFLRSYRNDIDILKQLSGNIGAMHDFMLFPSNKVTSFECRDRVLETDTYGKNLRGYSIAYGKTMDESLAASEVTIGFTDDRDLHLLRMHDMWIRYIDGVKKGRYRPIDAYLYGKILDYACSAYFIVCAENGEDIIYWSKLYGIFPTNIPDSIMSWNKGQLLSHPEFTITYKYSWKRDLDSSIITEFNLNGSKSKDYRFARTHNDSILSTGETWVGSPFIESVVENGRIVYKLRFRIK